MKRSTKLQSGGGPSGNRPSKTLIKTVKERLGALKAEMGKENSRNAEIKNILTEIRDTSKSQ